MRHRHDIIVTGMAVADQPIETISLVVAGEVRSLSLCARTAQCQQVFRLTLAKRKYPGPDLSSFVVAARTLDGNEHRTTFTMAIDWNDPQGACLVEGPVCELSPVVKALTPILLFVETAVVNLNGVVHVAGWCAALMQIVAIQVLIGEQRVGFVRCGQSRDDVARLYPAYPNARLSGFTYSEALPEGATLESITVEAIDLSGSASRVVIPVDLEAAAPEASAFAGTVAPALPDPRLTIFAHCDAAILCTDGELQVCGWAICATAIAAVAVYLDGELIGSAALGLQRLDVIEKYPGIPLARYSGFELRERLAAPLSGEHQVLIRIRNGLDDSRDLLKTVTVTDPLYRASGLSPATSQEIRFQLDHPLVIDGAVPTPVVGRLVLEGWALAHSGIDAIDVFLDGRILGQAYYGIGRRDVEGAHPDWENAFRSGYIFHCPPRVLESGAHTVQLKLRAKNGETFESAFQIDVQQSQDGKDYASIRRRLSRIEIDLYQDLLDRLECRPDFKLLLIARSPLAPEKLYATLRSLSAQAYRGWQLMLVIDTEDLTDWLAIADDAGVRDRVTIISAQASSRRLIDPSATRTPCLVGVLFPGDQLGCDALAEIAVARGLHPEAQFFYADENRLSPSSHVREPFFKPGWSPDLLLSTNYIGRPWFATADLFVQAGITPRLLSAQQGDYDGILRCTELASHIHHLPKLLCFRCDSDEAERDGEQRVLESAIARRSIEAKLLPGCVPGTWRLKRTVSAKGTVSIIIPTCAAKGYVATCLETLRSRTAYRNFEIICIDNIPPDQPEWKELVRKEADKVVDIPEAFNWSRFNNRAADQAVGEYLLFLNDDIEVQQEDWLEALLEHAQRPEVGVVGPQLLYPDRKVQHAGIFLTTLGAGRHSFRFLAEDDPGYFGLALTQRNVIAVTGACMLMRREVFERIGRFNEAHEVINNDVDCCLRAWKAGLSIVYTPHAQLIHHELASRANVKDSFDSGHFAKQWRGLYASGDPYFSPRLTKLADEYNPDTEPAWAICASRPLFGKDEIQRILAVKLDHIGDLITALPALRRLRRHFPSARIYLLATRAAKAFLADEDCVDELIEFEFFHARSGLGQRGITEQDLLALGERLAPYRFDLAIDLRKQLETRHVLNYVPARFRAGYNHLGRFPWLDVALEWEGDDQLHRKQSHVSDDLVRLVEAVAIASESDLSALPQTMSRDEKLPVNLSAAARALFCKPVVAVHPGVGAIMRQWMPEYFATVIDLLIEKNDVNVVLVGGPDEAKLAKEVLGHVVNRRNVVSLAGRTSLPALTGLLRACTLYLGNNSGPQHIAAALGLPTVGIYSGVVDAAEWGPTGPRAIAVQRNMICSPCYLVKPDECVRDMACLKRLEPAVVHQYCEMMLARVVPAAESRCGKGVS
jgi:ADP-heptose:LPS heptosyltransferase/GT2 family glycosyltransferase